MDAAAASGGVGGIDWAIVGVYFAGTIAVGLWAAGRRGGLEDYVLGGRDLPWLALLVSIVATETSSVTFLSVPGKGYAGDFTFLQLAIGLVVGRVLVAWLLLPLYFRGKLLTAYQVLAERFGGATQRTASLLFVAARTVSDGLRLYLTAKMLQAASGWPIDLSIATMAAATVLYTALGGMRAVVWTDVVQFVVYMLGAVLALAALAAAAPEGLAGVWRNAAQLGKLQLWDLSWDLSKQDTLWCGLFGGAALALGTHGVDQLMVQRYLCARSQGQAALALVASGFAVLAQFAMFLAIGVFLAEYYARTAPGMELRPDEVFMRFLVEKLPQGAVGLTLAAVFSAAMSTLSSSLNSSATAVVADLLPQQPGQGPSVAATRGWTVAFGVAQAAVACLAERCLTASVIDQVLAIAGMTFGVLLGVFLLGIATRVRQPAALVGLAVGTAVVLTAKFAAQVAGPWLALLGAASVAAAGLAAEAALSGPAAAGQPGGTTACD